MSRAGTWASFSSFAKGEVSDIDSNLIPDDALAYAQNVISDKDGRIKKRGPIVPYLESSASGFYHALGASNDAEFSDLQRGYGARPGSGLSAQKVILDAFAIGNDAYSGVLTTGVASSATPDVGEYNSPVINNSFNTFGFCGFPVSDSTSVIGNQYNTLPFIWAGGADPSLTWRTSTIACTITANRAVVTFPSLGAYTTFRNGVDMRGQFFYGLQSFSYTGADQYEYVGRIIAQDDSLGTITVSPAPTNSFTTVAVYRTSTFGMAGANGEAGGGARPMGATCATIHENRVVCVPQGTAKYSSPNPFNQASFERIVPRSDTIVWSAISGESATAVTTKSDGLLPLLYAGWPKEQSLTLDTAGITGLVSLDANNLMVLCVDKIVVLSGKLGTVLPNAGVNTNSINIRTISNNIGCPYPQTIQRTPLGIMFSDESSVYITDGSSFVNTMENRIQQSYGYFAGSVGAFGADYPCGSAVIGNSHYVLFTKYGKNFVCDFTKNYAWTRLYSGDGTWSGTSNVTFATGIEDPSGNGKVYAPLFQVDPANQTSPTSSGVCLVNTILKTSGVITSSSPGFKLGYDASASDPYNADFITKSFMFGSSRLKWIKRATFLYECDLVYGTNNAIRVAPVLGTDADVNSPFVCETYLPGSFSFAKPDTVIRRAFDDSVASPGRNFNASAFALRFTTRFVAYPVGPGFPVPDTANNFALTEFQINYVPLRMGRVAR